MQCSVGLTSRQPALDTCLLGSANSLQLFPEVKGDLVERLDMVGLYICNDDYQSVVKAKLILFSCPGVPQHRTSG